MILPETGAVEAAQVAERVRFVISDTVFSFENVNMKVTISIGISMFPHDGSDRISLIRAADDAMYESKRRGRNRVTVYKRDAGEGAYDDEPRISNTSPHE